MVTCSNLGPAGIVGGGSECTALSPPSIPQLGALEQGTGSPTAPRAPQHKWLPTALGMSVVCVFTAVCVHFGWVNCRARITSMGHHTWPYVTSHLYTYTIMQSRVMSDWQFFMSLLWGPAWFLCHSQSGCEVIYVLSQKAGHSSALLWQRIFNLTPCQKGAPLWRSV